MLICIFYHSRFLFCLAQDSQRSRCVLSSTRSALPQSPLGIPNYRTKVLYVPQRPSLLPGSPSTFLQSILSLSSQAHARPKSEQASSAFPTVHARAVDITESWDVDPELWDRDWANLSGGEAQRMLLALAIALDTAEVILLDGEFPFLSYFVYCMAEDV